jgi:hypothetical protein
VKAERTKKKHQGLEAGKVVKSQRCGGLGLLWAEVMLIWGDARRVYPPGVCGGAAYGGGDALYDRRRRGWEDLRVRFLNSCLAAIKYQQQGDRDSKSFKFFFTRLLDISAT